MSALDELTRDQLVMVGMMAIENVNHCLLIAKNDWMMHPDFRVGFHLSAIFWHGFVEKIKGRVEVIDSGNSI